MAFDPRSGETSDATLLARCGDADAAAAGELYRRHGPAVYRFVLMATGSPAEAADVLQETFMAVMERKAAFDPQRGSCTAYLCGVARHLMLRRYDRRTEPLAELDDALDLASSGLALAPPPHEAAERAQALGQLQAAIRALPPHYRDVLILVELQEMSYADAAAITGIELGTVRSRLARARARLVELFSAADAKGKTSP